MFVLFIILVIILSVLFLQDDGLQLLGGGGLKILGGGPTKEELCDRLDLNNKLRLKEFLGSTDNYDSFNKVDAADNQLVLKTLFRKEYINYPVLVQSSGIIEYLNTLANEPEIIFNHEKSYYKPELVCIKYTPQRVKYYHDHIEPRFVSPLNSLTHIGKIKLFVADLQALMYLLPKDAVDSPSGGGFKYTVIYIGSAPGHQTIILAEWFKNVKFLLYDGNRFDDRLKSMKNIEIFNTYFTDRETRKYHKSVHILISDIRLSMSNKSDSEVEYQIHKDMMMQQKWIIDMKPLLGSMVKFRPPYNHPELEKKNIPDAANYKYLGGKVYWQTFSNIQSTEGRLLSTAEDIAKGPVHFDYDKYEAGCLQNNLTRVWATYSPSIPDLANGQIDMSAELIRYPGFDRCFDCQYLLFALAEYIGKYHTKDYSPKRVLAAFDKVVTYNKNLVCTCDSSYNKNNKLYVHGLFQNLTRFQKHLKFIEMWNSFLHNI